MKGAFGESSHGKNPWKLARDFFTMSNDSFFAIHGFNWVPPEPIRSIVKKQMENHPVGGGYKYLPKKS